MVIAFVPPASPPGKGVREGGKLIKSLFRQAVTPNTWVQSTPPNPLPPTGGVIGSFLGTLGSGLGAWAVGELIFTPPAAKSALDEIDPNLLYPPSTEKIGETVIASETEQGIGSEIGLRYEVLFEWDSDINDENPPQQTWHLIHYAYRSPFKITAISYGGSNNAFPEVTGVLRGGRWYLLGMAHDQSGNEVELTPNTGTQLPGQGGIYTVARGQFLNMRPVGGQPVPPTVVEQTTEPPPPFDYTPIPLKIVGVTGLSFKPKPTIPNSKLSSPTPTADKTVNANPGGQEGQADNSTSVPEDTTATNARNGLSVNISSSVIDFPVITSDNLPDNVIVKKYSPEQYRQIKGRRDIQSEREQRTEEEQQRAQDRQQAPNYRISPPPNLDDSKVDDVINGATTGGEFTEGGQKEDILDKPESLKQTPPPDPNSDKISDTDLVKLAGIVLGAENLNKFKEATEQALCDSSTGGCLKNNVTDPILSGQNSWLETLTASLQGLDLSLLAVINDKLGAKLEPGGISAYMQTAWRALRVNKILDYLNTILLLHNAAMLSRNLAASLGSSISALANNTINLIKNEDGSDIDINETIGNTLSGFLISLLGTDNYQNLNEQFQRSSRILNAATNIINTIQFSLAGIAEGLETLGNYTGKIGNSLKKAGTVFENSYQWMSENFTVKTGRIGQIQAVLDGLEQVENITSDLTNVTEEFREVQENITQVEDQFNQIKTEIAAQETAKTELETTTKSNSQGAQPIATDYTPDPLE